MLTMTKDDFETRHLKKNISEKKYNPGMEIYNYTKVIN
jgi:hypothetical protein